MKTLKLEKTFDRENIVPYPFYIAEEVRTGSDMNEILGIDNSDISMMEIKDRHVYGYAQMPYIKKTSQIIFDKIISQKDYFSLVKENIFTFSEELIQFSEKVRKENFTNFSKNELLSLYLEYIALIKKTRKWGWVPVILDGYGEPLLSNFLKEELGKVLAKQNKKSLFAQYYSILSSPSEMSQVRKEELERLMLAKSFSKELRNTFRNHSVDEILNTIKIKQEENIFKAIQAHTKKYEWIHYEYLGPILSIRDLISMIKDTLREHNDGELEKNIFAMKEHYTQIKDEKKRLIKEIQLPEKLEYLFHVMEVFMYIKDYRKMAYQKSYVAMDGVLKEMAMRTQLNLIDLKYMTTDEIKSLINDNWDVNINKLLSERKKYCVVFIQNGHTKIYANEDAKDIMDKYLASVKKEEEREVHEIKGMISYYGKVKGIVKIINTTDDIKKMEEGNVLVSSSTNPDLVPAMKKAAAFVTDMGGITSHAAIVSRELKVPCIIGTKVATQVLHDGDLVEVDADNGVVKILERAEEKEEKEV